MAAKRFDIATVWVVMKQHCARLRLLNSTWLVLGGHCYSACCTFHPPPMERRENYSQGEQSACKLISECPLSDPHICFERRKSRAPARSHGHGHQINKKEKVLMLGIGFAPFVGINFAGNDNFTRHYIRTLYETEAHAGDICFLQC